MTWGLWGRLLRRAHNLCAADGAGPESFREGTDWALQHRALFSFIHVIFQAASALAERAHPGHLPK